MNRNEERQTICGRSFTINLSTADVLRLFDKAGSVGLTPSELIENFVGDLVDGTYSNGSDERMYANQWFDRCGFSICFGHMSFLQWLINCSDVESVVNDWYLLQDYQEDFDELDEDNKAFAENIKNGLKAVFDEYLTARTAKKDSTFENEMEQVVKWYSARLSASAELPRCESDEEDNEYEM